MISQECHNAYSTIAIFRIFQRFLRRARLLCRRYAQYHQMKRNYEELLQMEDRLLKDIGLSRSDVGRLIRGHKFWRHMLQAEEGDNAIEQSPKKETVCNAEPIQGHCASDLCLCSPDHTFSRN